MFLSGLISLKSTLSLFVLLIAVGIGSFLYLTLNTDFESQPRTLFRSGGSDPLKTSISTENLNQIMNTARQAWSI
ncbi:unnamed protein product, partial [Rotaria magnacalcarata]